MAGDIGIVIVAHGQLAHEYRAAVEHVVGPQPNIVAVSIAAECDRNDKELEICEAVDAVDNGCGVVIATDLFGSSPSNLALKACATKNRKMTEYKTFPELVYNLSILRKTTSPPLRSEAYVRFSGPITHP